MSESSPRMGGQSSLADDLEMILARTLPLWEEMRGGRLFLTGGSGFFGCWLLESFIHANRVLELGAEVVVLSRDPAAFRSRAPHLASAGCVTLLQGNVTQFTPPQGNFTHIIHAASELSMSQPKDALGLIETTLLGTRRVLDFARESGARKFLFTSSGAVYGPMTPGRKHLCEDDPVSTLPLEPRSAYAEAKRLAELVCAIYGQEHGIEIKIARGFAFLGPHLSLDSHLAAASFLRSALHDEPITIQSHGCVVRSYLYGADLAIWLWTILFKGTSGRPYNLGSDVPVSITELAASIQAAVSVPLTVNVLGKLKPDELVDIYVPDIHRSRTELGLDVFTPLAEAIRRTLLFHNDIASHA
ncbi:NAD-dependent epimerase/dehydratase family protein [Prosthecobacter sp.]|uniref:NAD-dependent epimerase/dehydratase family protein n=1 Tax=Prosthecobacter sp. TaxID=1965333 RepID=UPI002489CE3C|nr:NAD-dependent epimerase/dehydratase family protein [Prosthecobacter sp.]MDI1315495.1 NAD-dependent epimerase/dehydratase family protein [Prosthecobacter sp.]